MAIILWPLLAILPFVFPCVTRLSYAMFLDYDANCYHSGLGMYFGHPLSMTLESILSAIHHIISKTGVFLIGLLEV
jgi:hypothetical protein